MAQALIVELVKTTERVWFGEARQVTVRTTEGEMGILPGHVPTAGVLAPGRVKVISADGEGFTGRVESGFVSVDGNRVTIAADSITQD